MAIDRGPAGQLDPAVASGYRDPPPRKGFFTDTTVCIGCKACEVACKEWNLVPEDGLNLLGMSYDNTGSLNADTWRHVAFIEQPVTVGRQAPAFVGMPTGPSSGVDVSMVRAATTPARTGARHAARDGGGPEFLGMPSAQLPGQAATGPRTGFRWLMSSDVCKHCTHAACLDVCPTGALFRTEFGTVVVQQDVCNGCGYCVPACPYGVIDQRKGDGRAWKCTLCYDRLKGDLMPACAKACPTESIQFGDLDELRERATDRIRELHELGVTEARLYGEDPTNGVGGDGAFFLLLDEPEVYGFPPDPVVTTRDLPRMWQRAGVAALAMAAAVVAAFAGGSL